MQQLLADAFVSRWYFAFGDEQKSSLSAQFCRENGFDYYKDPTVEQAKFFQRDTIIEGSLQLFLELEKIKPELHVIYFGKDYSNPTLKKIRKAYQQIGYCKDVTTLDHNSCRKALYPNLILIYGPIYEQNKEASIMLANNICYNYSDLPEDPNNLIQNTQKTKNYVINGLFTNPNHIKILSEYFNIRILHFKYKREDLPKYSTFFDEEHDLVNFLKDKPYYLEINGQEAIPNFIMDAVGTKLCPRLLYINGRNSENYQFVEQYVEETDALYLSVFDIQQTRKNKRIPVAGTLNQKIQMLNETIYKDLNRKQIIFADFPWQTSQFIQLEARNRKFDWFIDLSPQSTYTYSKTYSSPIYFLENQKRIAPSFDLPLRQEIANQVEYWIVTSPGTCGKTTVAKFLQMEFGFKVIDFQVELAAAKEKIASPEDGDQIPVRKYVAYFANIIKGNPQNTYVIDTLPYTGADLDLWIREVGSPNVINLKAEPSQLLKRLRKKSQSDQSSQISEQQSTKISESLQKNSQHMQAILLQSPSTKLYQVDYNNAQLLSQQHISSILRPRIFLTQKNNSLLYQNIAIKYGMGFVNLRGRQLKDCLLDVRKLGKRDVILCGWEEKEGELVSQGLYWVERGLGEIRYLGIWEPQEIQIKENIMKLERPPEPVKKKPVQGEQPQEEQPPAEQGEQGKAKKLFDIYQHEWTQPSCHKNLSQWFFKLKKNIIKKQNIFKACYTNFGEVLDALNRDRTVNFYQIVK